MLKNIFTPLSGALAQEKVMDIIANNLANANTVGYKEESVSFKLLDPEPEKNYIEPLPPANYKLDLSPMLPFRGNEFSYVGVSGVYRSNLQGNAIQTENPLDLMIEGEGFLTVQTKEGLRYTRNGSLSLERDGTLCDKNGHPILGEKGVINIKGKDIQINPRGEIYQDGELVDRLLVFDFENKDQLEKVGLNNYFYEGLSEDIHRLDFPNVRQGYLEASNVNAIKNLTAMILAHRSYEAYQQAIKNYDSMMDRSANRIGQVQA